MSELSFAKRFWYKLWSGWMMYSLGTMKLGQSRREGGNSPRKRDDNRHPGPLTCSKRIFSTNISVVLVRVTTRISLLSHLRYAWAQTVRTASR